MSCSQSMILAHGQPPSLWKAPAGSRAASYACETLYVVRPRYEEQVNQPVHSSCAANFPEWSLLCAVCCSCLCWPCARYVAGFCSNAFLHPGAQKDIFSPWYCVVNLAVSVSTIMPQTGSMACAIVFAPSLLLCDRKRRMMFFSSWTEEEIAHVQSLPPG